MADVQETVQRGQAPGLLWWCMVAGPLAWGCDLGFSYALTYHACSTGHHYVLHLVSVLCFLLALTGAAAGYSEYQKLPHEASEEGRRPFDRAYFQVLFGTVFSIAFAITVIAGAVPRWILNPCQ